MKARLKHVMGRRFGPLTTKRGGERAFTLIEMLVVIAIMALLAVLLVPALGGVLGSVRSKQCANNLKRIAGGVRLREAAGQDHVQALAWQEMIRDYIGGDTRCLVCTEFAEARQDIVNPVPLKDLVQFKVVMDTGSVYYQDLDKGSCVVKLSDGQYQEAKANNWLGNTNTSNNFPPARFPPPPFPRARYEDGSEEKSNPYWLCLNLRYG